MLKLYYTYTPILDNVNINDLIKILPVETMKKISGFKNENAQKQSLLAQFLLFKASSDSGIANPISIIDYNAHGKPFLRDNPYYFNISHSEELVAVLISDYECGLDVQHTDAKKSSRTLMDIAGRFFTENENNYLQNLDIKKQKNEFFRIWAIKESYLKYLGTGLSEPLNSFNVTIAPCSDSYADDCAYIISGKETSFVKVLEPRFSSEYQVAICVSRDIHNSEIELFAITNLSEFGLNM